VVEAGRCLVFSQALSHSTGNQTKDYINIMKSFNLDYSNEEIDIKQDFLENIKNLQSILK